MFVQVKPEAKTYFPILNFLRCMASLGVCAIHMHYTTKLYESHTFSKIITFGQQGVAVFFVISGFIIPYSLWQSGYNIKHFFRFLLKRSIRIDPPYMTAILFCLGIAYHFKGIDALKWFLHLFYLIPFTNYDWYLGIFWTLGIEFQYYVIIGLLFPWLKQGNIILVCTILLFSAFTGYFIPIAKNNAFLLGHVHYFVMGLLCYLFMQKRITLTAVHLVLALLTGYLCIRISLVTGLVGYLASLCILHLNFRTKLTDFLGKISYSLYLVHSVTGVVMLQWLNKLSVYDPFIQYSIIMVACIFSAYLFWLIVERPSHQWSKKIKLSTA